MGGNSEGGRKSWRTRVKNAGGKAAALELHRAASAAGGRAGKGKSKRRGDRKHYSNLGKVGGTAPKKAVDKTVDKAQGV